MADYSELIAQIQAVIRTNGTGAITGQTLQDVLVMMVNNYPEAEGGGGTEVQTVDVADLDGMVTGPTDYAMARDTGIYVVTSGGWNAGRLFVFSDSMHHVVTQVLLTHYTGEDNTLNTHTDGEIHLLYRSYGLSGVPAGHGVPEGAWSAWQDVLGQTTAGLDARVTALEETTDAQERELEDVSAVALSAQTWANVSVPAVFDAVVAGPLSIQQNSTRNPTRIVYSTADKRFCAQQGLAYYFSWTYATQDGAHRDTAAYGVRGKTYLCTGTGQLYVMAVDGSLLAVSGGGGGGQTYDVVTDDTAGLASSEMFTRLLQSEVFKYSGVAGDGEEHCEQLAGKLTAWCGEPQPIMRQYETNNGSNQDYRQGLCLMWRSIGGTARFAACFEGADRSVLLGRAFLLRFDNTGGAWAYKGYVDLSGQAGDEYLSEWIASVQTQQINDRTNQFIACIDNANARDGASQEPESGPYYDKASGYFVVQDRDGNHYKEWPDTFTPMAAYQPKGGGPITGKLFYAINEEAVYMAGDGGTFVKIGGA